MCSSYLPLGVPQLVLLDITCARERDARSGRAGRHSDDMVVREQRGIEVR
jgi:hypothetical protein